MRRDREEEKDDPLDELEGFDDFTLASSWERFISDIEAICRLWMVDGPKNLMDKGAEQSYVKSLYRVKSELKYGTKSYCMEYYFDVDNQGEVHDWSDGKHNMQLLFGVKDFLVIAPVSVSKVILDAPEASKLLSSVAIALSNCGCVWPAFVPVHDPSRRAYIGIQNMGMIFTRRFETDRIGSQVPIKLMHLEGLYELFVSKFALSVTDISTRYFNVQFTMKLTYQTPPSDDNDDTFQDFQSSGEEIYSSPSNLKPQWDDNCPWIEWYSAEDPVKGFELIAFWPRVMVGSSFEMAEIENVSPIDAEKWLILPIFATYMNDESVTTQTGFASQLQNLTNVLDMSFDGKFLEDFVSAESSSSDNAASRDVIPPPTVIDRVLKDIFQESNKGSSQIPEHSNARAIKGAPSYSLFAHFCLHALWFGNCNIRAIAALWIEFVREIRWCWEESETLPRMPIDGVIDLSTCLIHQKLQMLAICIERKNPRHNVQDNSEGNDAEFQDSLDEFQSPVEELDGRSSLDCLKKDMMLEQENTSMHLGDEPLDNARRGSSGIYQSMMLLHSHQPMHTPYVQEAPIMTEDMHEERLHAFEAFGNSFGSFGQLEKDMLSSDMSAFKAANPDAIFEDFIRWRSPGDWEEEVLNENFVKNSADARTSWPPRGKLSQRMSDSGNSWRQIWNESPPLPISEQKPLLDPVREGEKVLHYFETLRPNQLLAQMICSSFRISLHTLSQASYGNLKQLNTKIGQLCQTIALTLKPLSGNHLPDKVEFISDLKRLCVIFRQIEKLVLVAASLHRKLIDAPRLSEAIFCDYFNFYLPKFGMGLTNICYDKEFDSKHPVKRNERDSVARLFPPPTSNQSWRKVLSMGNLLNGHEPIGREIIFLASDMVGSGRYGANGGQSSASEEAEVETYRMYVSGSANDLQVALSVISWD